MCRIEGDVLPVGCMAADPLDPCSLEEAACVRRKSVGSRPRVEGDGNLGGLPLYCLVYYYFLQFAKCTLVMGTKEF